MSEPVTTGTGAVGAPALPCPAGTTADLIVHVVCGHDGMDAQGAKVELKPPVPQSPRITSSSGICTFSSIAPGVYSVTASKDKHTPATKKVTVACGGQTNAELQLSRGPLTCYLRLTYKDPADATRPFPAGIPVQVLIGKTPPKTVNTQDNGKLQFDVPPGQDEVRLSFAGGVRRYIAVRSAETKAAKDDLLVLEAALEPILKDHYHVFLLPTVNWTMSQSDWTVEGFDYKDGVFRGFNHCEVKCGTPDEPVQVNLDPHWQYLRFVYFDRLLGHTTHKDKRVSVPPLLIEGYRSAPAGAATPTDTRSNWTIGDAPEVLKQCLPWIVQRKVDGTAEPKPDANIQLQFRTDDAHRFIESKADGTRRYGPLPPAQDKPGPDRLRYYDMPTAWKSRRYFAQFDELVAHPGNRFEALAAQATTRDRPLMFCLDDIVLTDQNLDPVTWVPANRAAIFWHRFEPKTGTLIGDFGLYQRDSLNSQSYLTQAPSAPDVEIDRNYIADYPDWTRLVIAQANMYDVFDQRTPDHATRVVGARAGVRLLDVTQYIAGMSLWYPQPDGKYRKGANAPAVPTLNIDPTPGVSSRTYFHIQPFYETRHDRTDTAAANDDYGIGRYDLACLRCCYVDNNREMAVLFQYHRLFFDYTDATVPAPGVSIAAADQAAYSDEAARQISLRWTGPQPVYHPDPPLLLPEDATKPLQEDAARRVRARVLRFVQVAPSANQAHYKIDVHLETPTRLVRAFMSSFDGTGQMKQTDNKPNFNPGADDDGRFTAAHETGHAGTLGDEYIEKSNSGSYYESGFMSYLPGAPYAPDERGMMKGNKDMRARYFWFLAEWLRARDGNKPFFIQQGAFNYRLPHHPTAKRSWVDWPLRRAMSQSVGARGNYDLFLYALGADQYAQNGHVTGQTLDGLLIVVIKLRIHVNGAAIWGAAPVAATVQTEIEQAVTHIKTDIETAMNMRPGKMGRFFATGTAPAAAPAPAQTFSNCLIRISPRFLVTSFSGEQRYARKMTVYQESPNPTPPPANVFNLSATITAYNNRISSISQAQGVHFDIVVQPAAAGAAAAATWNAAGAPAITVWQPPTPAPAPAAAVLNPAPVVNRTMTVTYTNNAGDPKWFDQIGPLIRDRIPDMLGIARANAAAVVSADLDPLVAKVIATNGHAKAYV